MSPTPSSQGKLMLIDASALFHRAFYALPGLATSTGQPTGALYGLTSMLIKLLADERPDYVAVAFDRPGPTVRHEEFAEYKGTRRPMPDELRAQVPFLRPLIEAMGLTTFEYEGYEADDVLGTLARLGEEAGCSVIIVTGDMDVLQLVSPKVEALITRRGISTVDRYAVDDVVERLGVGPELVTDYKGLTGDTSDNIPGVPGIGPKTAERLLREYGSLENVLAHREEIKGKVGESLREHVEAARLSKRLATIQTDLPLSVEWERLRFHSPVSPELLDLFRQLEFARLIEEVQKRFPQETADHGEQRAEQPSAVEVRIVEPEELADWCADWEAFTGDALVFVAPFADGAWRTPDSALFVARRLPEGNKVELTWLAFGGQDPRRDEIAANLDRLWQAPARWLAYDAKSVLLYLRRHEMPAPAFSDDVMLASYVLSPGQGDHSPQDIALKYVQESVPGVTPSTDAWLQTAKAGGQICSALFRAWDVLQGRLTEENLEQVYRTIEMPLVGVLADMEWTGVALDVPFLQSMAVEMDGELQALTERIYELAGREFNINSPKQLAEVLFTDLGLPVIKRTKTGPSTDAAVLEELAGKHPIVAALLDYRQAAKLKSTYVDTLPALVDPQTKRVHTTFKQAVTATGRLSSVHPNVQNIPIRTKAGRQIRRAFIPESSDYVLLSADYSQIELRVLAHMSGDDGMINAFRTGADIHAKTASEIFGVALADVTPQMREAAKAVNFGIVYGISSFGLARDTGLTREEAERYIEAYFERYPGVKAYMQESVAKAKAVGYAETIMGRKRWIPNLHSRNWAQRSFAERAAINTPIQGSAADIIKKAMCTIHELLRSRSYRARLLLQVHDELLFEVHRDDLLPVARLVRGAMEQALELQVPLVCDVMAGPNWRDMEEVP